MRLPNPNQGKPFDREEGDYGYRNEHTPDAEIVHLPSGQSNQTYWQPEMVLNPEGCSHQFAITDIGQREIECQHCHYATNFHSGINYQELNGQPTVTLKGVAYILATPTR